MNKPQRPHAPNAKGLSDGVTKEVKFRKDAFKSLHDRARYETLRYRIQHGGKGHVVTWSDIVRRLVDDYFEKVSALPADAVGKALRALDRR